MEKRLDRNLTRKTLLYRVQHGTSEEAWDDFAEKYRDYIFLVILNLGLQREDAEDLVQEVLLKVWKSVKNFNYQPHKCKFRTWLCRICRNSVSSYLRKKKIRVNTDVLGKIESLTEPDVDKIAKKEWEHYISNLAWLKVKDRFDDKTQKAFLGFVSGAPAAEVSSKLGIAESSVRVYFNRIKNAMIKEINILDDELSMRQ